MARATSGPDPEDLPATTGALKTGGTAVIRSPERFVPGSVSIVIGLSAPGRGAAAAAASRRKSENTAERPDQAQEERHSLPSVLLGQRGVKSNI